MIFILDSRTVEDAESKSDGISKNGPKHETSQMYSDLRSVFQDFAAENITPPLEEIYDSRAMKRVVENDKDFQDELISLLPEGQQSLEELYHTICSPQLTQAFTRLSHYICDSDSFNSLMASVQLDPMDGADFLERGDVIGAFSCSTERSR